MEYKELRMNSICVHCHQKLDDDRIGKSLCSKCKHKQYLVIRSRAERLMAEGKCTVCKKICDREGKRFCTVCKEKCRKANSRKIKRRRDNHLCISCGSAELEKKHYCKFCYERHLSNTKKLRTKRLLLGLCTKCGKTNSAENKRLCLSCIKYNRNKMQEYMKDPKKYKHLQERIRRRYKQMKSDGICLICRSKHDTGLCYCEKCRKTESKRIAQLIKERKKQGLCMRCGSTERISAGGRCAKCLQYAAAWQRNKSKKEAAV